MPTLEFHNSLWRVNICCYFSRELVTCYGFRKPLDTLINFKVKKIEFFIVVFKNLLLSHRQLNKSKQHTCNFHGGDLETLANRHGLSENLSFADTYQEELKYSVPWLMDFFSLSNRFTTRKHELYSYLFGARISWVQITFLISVRVKDLPHTTHCLPKGRMMAWLNVTYTAFNK